VNPVKRETDVVDMTDAVLVDVMVNGAESKAPGSVSRVVVTEIILATKFGFNLVPYVLYRARMSYSTSWGVRADISKFIPCAKGKVAHE
jgi:hypothetical protein